MQVDPPAQQKIDLYFDSQHQVYFVGKTTEGKDRIIFSNQAWDKMQAGTKYVSGNLSIGMPVQFCLEISNKEKDLCRGGIGFSCSVFDCKERNGKDPAIVDRNNRICSVLLEKKDACAVALIFLDKVDWESLRQ